MSADALPEAAWSAGFLRSALISEGGFISTEAVLDWLQSRRAANRFEVERIPLADIAGWAFIENPLRFAHHSGKFFAIEGLRVRGGQGSVTEWDQPIINQPEIGILGLATALFEGVRYFLMQAKMEPGNVNTMQLSPTVQATRSNYTRVHQGGTPTYLDCFTKAGRSRILVDQLQSEQGARFLRKRNRNMIVEVDAALPVQDDFCWLTLGQIHQLLRKDNVVNMDARSVLSCIPYSAATCCARPLPRGEEVGEWSVAPVSEFGRALLESLAPGAPSKHTEDAVISWLSDQKSRCELAVERLSLDKLRDWRVADDDIRHISDRYFSVIGVSVEAGSREVVHWAQPILEHRGCGLVGLLTMRLNGVLHALMRSSTEPGCLDLLDIGPTVACAAPGQRAGSAQAPYFLDYFWPHEKAQVRYSGVQSEEGGRFYHFQNRYVVLELLPESPIEVPNDFLWLTLSQIARLSKYGALNIEARNVLACLRFLE